MSKADCLSILLLDDNYETVEFYKRQIESDGRLVVTPQTDGQRACTLTEHQLFDVVVIDAKLGYRGVEIGGLRLADDIRPRYGANSILIISRYITTEFMQIAHGPRHEFLPKPSTKTSGRFGSTIRTKLLEMRQRQFAFVAMPFRHVIPNIYNDYIKMGVESAGFACRRADEISHSRGIQETIFDLVNNSKIVVFVADDGNANAYFEAGVAYALRKEVVIVARDPSELKFDVSNRPAIFYGNNPECIREQLFRVINDIRLTPPLGV